MNMAYDKNNVFAKILRGELPCYKVYEDQTALVFMDIMPRSDGHCLVIPKAPSVHLLDISADDLAHLIRVVQKIALAAKTAFNAEGVLIQQSTGAAAGQEVPHLHFHVMPRKEGMPLRVRKQADGSLLAKHANLIKAAL